MKATIKVRDIEIALEGSPGDIAVAVRSVITSTAPLALPAGPPVDLDEQAAQDAPATDEQAAKAAKDARGRTDPLPEARSFFELKKPTNNREATAVAAYYLREVAPDAERSSTLTKDLLVSVFREGRWKLPARPEQTLVDAEAGGYLRRTDRGVYELTNTGHNLVVHTLGAQD